MQRDRLKNKSTTVQRQIEVELTDNTMGMVIVDVE